MRTALRSNFPANRRNLTFKFGTVSDGGALLDGASELSSDVVMVVSTVMNVLDAVYAFSLATHLNIFRFNFCLDG